ncbi:4-hydroxybenzoate polyprenyltransferase [Flaviramulus basaltis]|uniref:4-hydroxybenzoate polyprenyltransferase n=1 Tax=Flaviramulus basaltis TaxID=369401 RepID=A0A1K2IGX1_9FLAO|nr:UbiA-like protein EboC [Flaviramulus basaltis]SFZ90915.1 4-hydroxybenzoate polyprenyltransferase [Flaviramulus basaltis]
MKTWSAMLLIMRPANIITAIADILAGIAIAGFFAPEILNQQIVFQIILLSIATAGLYGGGIVFNDVFDLYLDKINRPERVIPSGRLSLNKAKTLGIVLFLLGIIAAFCISIFSGFIAITTMICALMYDKYGKHHTFLGPINMGLCRGLNLILGMSINPELDPKYFLIAILPVIFVSAITLTAQKETKGKNKLAIGLAMVLDACIVVGFWIISQHFNFSIKNTFIFLLLWYAVNAISKLNAIVNNSPKLIMKAVKIGVLSLIPLNASYVAGFSSVYIAILVLCLLPISLFLSKKFPVT